MNNSKRVVLTIDDLPFSLPNAIAEEEEGIRVTDLLLQQLKENDVKTVSFVVGSHTAKGNRASLLEKWHREGNILGNHTYSHLSLKHLSLAEFETDVIRSETFLTPYWEEYPIAQRYFRFPYLDHGATAEQREKATAILVERSYTIVPVTIDAKDYIYDTLYTNAWLDGDKEEMEAIVALYLEYTKAVIQFRDKQALQFANRPLGQIMLIHANRINACCLDKVIGIVKQQGYTFATLEEVLTEPIYHQGVAMINMGRFLVWESPMGNGEVIRISYPNVNQLVWEAYRTLEISTAYQEDKTNIIGEVKND